MLQYISQSSVGSVCSVSVTEGLRKTNTEIDLISGCACKLREVQEHFSDNQGDGSRR